MLSKKLQCPVRESISSPARRNKQNYHSISFFLFLLVDKRSTRNENYKSQDIWKCLLKENCGVDKRRHVITESQKIYNYLLGLDYHNKTLHLHSVMQFNGLPDYIRLAYLYCTLIQKVFAFLGFFFMMQNLAHLPTGMALRQWFSAGVSQLV